MHCALSSRIHSREVKQGAYYYYILNYFVCIRRLWLILFKKGFLNIIFWSWLGWPLSCTISRKHDILQRSRSSTHIYTLPSIFFWYIPCQYSFVVLCKIKEKFTIEEAANIRATPLRINRPDVHKHIPIIDILCKLQPLPQFYSPTLRRLRFKFDYLVHRSLLCKLFFFLIVNNTYWNLITNAPSIMLANLCQFYLVSSRLFLWKLIFRICILENLIEASWDCLQLCLYIIKAGVGTNCLRVWTVCCPGISRRYNTHVLQYCVTLRLSTAVSFPCSPGAGFTKFLQMQIWNLWIECNPGLVVIVIITTSKYKVVSIMVFHEVHCNLRSPLLFFIFTYLIAKVTMIAPEYDDRVVFAWIQIYSSGNCNFTLPSILCKTRERKYLQTNGY